MPNIEIHGLMGNTKELKIKIDKKMQEIGLGDDAITTIFNSKPESCDGLGDGIGKQLPFLRIYASDKNELDKIINALKEMQLWLDVETLILNSFILKEKMI